MQPSASSDHLTTESIRKPNEDRWGYGHTSLCFCGAGVLILVIVLSAAHDQVVTVGWIGMLALSVTLSVCGLIGALTAFGDRRTDKARLMFAEDIFALEHHVIGTSTAVDKWIEADSAQAVRSKEARDRLERMERLMLVLAGKLEGAADFGDRLGATEQGMMTLVRGLREVADRQSRESSSIEVRLEALEKRILQLIDVLGYESAEVTRRQEPRPQLPRTRRQRKRAQSATEGGNVVPMLSPETTRAARGLAARFVRDQRKQAEDRTEDN